MQFQIPELRTLIVFSMVFTFSKLNLKLPQPVYRHKSPDVIFRTKKTNMLVLLKRFPFQKNPIIFV
jgi:hypothetical protein